MIHLKKILACTIDDVKIPALRRMLYLPIQTIHDHRVNIAQLNYGYEGYRQFPLPRPQVYFQGHSKEE